MRPQPGGRGDRSVPGDYPCAKDCFNEAPARRPGRCRRPRDRIIGRTTASMRPQPGGRGDCRPCLPFRYNALSAVARALRRNNGRRQHADFLGDRGRCHNPLIHNVKQRCERCPAFPRHWSARTIGGSSKSKHPAPPRRLPPRAPPARRCVPGSRPAASRSPPSRGRAEARGRRRGRLPPSTRP